MAWLNQPHTTPWWRCPICRVLAVITTILAIAAVVVA